jgi:hypothetical protein
MTKDFINVKLRPFGLWIQNNRDGYSYFIDAEGNQIGASVMICYLNDATREQWVQFAAQAWGQHESQSLPFDAVTCVKALNATGSAVEARKLLTAAATIGRDPVELWEALAPFRENPFNPNKQTS